MNFKSIVLPGVRAFTSTMRVKLTRDQSLPVRANSPFAAHSPSAKTVLRPKVGWRISPATGQLEQRWSSADSLDPQCMGWAIPFVRYARH
jgi:hypothetical protein